MEDEFKIISKTEMGILIKNKMKNGLTYPKAQEQLFGEIQHLNEYYSSINEKDKENLHFAKLNQGRDTTSTILFTPNKKRGVRVKTGLKTLAESVDENERFKKLEGGNERNERRK
jgi:hypothetical protein